MNEELPLIRAVVLKLYWIAFHLAVFYCRSVPPRKSHPGAARRFQLLNLMAIMYSGALL